MKKTLLIAFLFAASCKANLNVSGQDGNDSGSDIVDNSDLRDASDDVSKDMSSSNLDTQSDLSEDLSFDVTPDSDDCDDDEDCDDRPCIEGSELSQNSAGISMGVVREFESTLHSIGIEWDLQGDDNHNAEANLRYRLTGSKYWKPFMPLLRMDYDYPREATVYGFPDEGPFNMFAGSLMFLKADSSYDICIEVTDPDGGSATQSLAISTKAIPKADPNGKTIYAAPGNGGGSGALDDPYLGLAAAEAAANEGDTVVLSAGNYGFFDFTKSGSLTKAIVYKSTQPKAATMQFATIASSHIVIEGVFFNQPGGYNAIQSVAGSSPTGVGIIGNSFEGHNYSINLLESASGWYIADNTIVGDKTVRVGSNVDFSGEGVELNHTNGHTVAFNTISFVADGVSYPHRHVDIYGNDIFDTTDDAIETDYGYANNRVWGNFIHEENTFAFSFQPVFSGPWYFIRNVVSGTSRILKFNGPVDRYVFLHNTIVNDGGIITEFARPLLSGTSLNNLFISGNSHIFDRGNWGPADFIPVPDFYQNDWRTDVDYNGYSWGNAAFGFGWRGDQFSTTAELFNTVGIEENGIRVDTSETFNNYPQDLTLKANGDAIDIATIIPGVQNNITGNAPDLGAYEFGNPLPHYGVRSTAADVLQWESYWEFNGN